MVYAEELAVTESPVLWQLVLTFLWEELGRAESSFCRGIPKMFHPRLKAPDCLLLGVQLLGMGT